MDKLAFDISIIYVNWNSVDYLKESIESIYQNTQGLRFEIIVVDNASPERDIDVIGEQFSEVTIIKSKDNLGFAGANNVGFERSSGAHVLFLNPDTKLVSPAINVLLQHMETLPDAGVVGCKLLNSDLSVQTTAIQRFPTILNQVLDTEYFQLRWPHCPLWEIGPLFSEQATVSRVDVISGACMLLRRDVFDRAGRFSEEYFMYAEDIDLNYKVRRAGFTNYYVGEATVIHHGGRSSSQQTVSYWSTIMKYRAMRQLFRKIKGRRYGSLYRVAIGCVAVARLALLALAYPLGNIVWDREAVTAAARKWTIILKWAVGWGLTVEGH